MQFDRGTSRPLRDERERMESGAGGRPRPHPREEAQRDEGHAPAARAGRPGGRPLLIIAEIWRRSPGHPGVNKLRGTLNCCARQAPGFGDRGGHAGGHRDRDRWQGDHGRPRDHAREPQSWRPRSGQEVVVDKDNTTIIEGAGKAKEIEGRIKQIRDKSRRRLGLRPGEAPGAARQAGGRRRRDQGRGGTRPR